MNEQWIQPQSQPKMQDLIAAWGKINQLVEENIQLKSTIETLKPQAENAIDSLAAQFESADLEMTVDIMKFDLEQNKEIINRHVGTINKQQKAIQNIVDENAELDSRITQLKKNGDKYIQAGLMLIKEKETLENEKVKDDKVIQNYYNILTQNRIDKVQKIEENSKLQRENFMLRNDIEILKEEKQVLVKNNEQLVNERSIKRNKKRKIKEMLKFGRKKNKN